VVCNIPVFHEHKQLDASQFSISVDTNGNKELHYTGRLCKNVQDIEYTTIPQSLFIIG
jgi:hypothetical protein